MASRVRIRDAAMALLASSGRDGVSIRAIARATGVSPALVMFHFGSKGGLIEAVDAHAAEVLERVSREAAAQSDLDAMRMVFASLAGHQDVLAYLGRSLVDGGGVGAALFDRLHALAVSVLGVMVDAGTARRVEDLEGTAAWLLAAELGALVLRVHLARALGADPYGPEGMDRFAAVELDLLSTPLLTLPDPNIR